MNRRRTYTDEELVAYLDQTLEADEQNDIENALLNDVDLRTRVDALTVDTDVLRDAFEPLLQNVPSIDLGSLPGVHSNTLKTQNNGDAEIHNADSTLSDQTKRVPSEGRGRKRWLSFAAAASVLAAVALTSYRIGTNSGNSGEQILDWRVAVADYQRLYVPATLPQGSPDSKTQQRQLEAVSRQSGFTVSKAMVELPNLNFKRAQTLGVGDQLLIQLAFATDEGEPVALCFTPDAGRKSDPRSEQIYDMNTVSWRNKDMGFVLMGRVPQQLLDETAARAVAMF